MQIVPLELALKRGPKGQAGGKQPVRLLRAVNVLTDVHPMRACSDPGSFRFQQPSGTVRITKTLL